MAKTELAEAFSQLVKEKHIDRDVLTEIIHSVLEAMVRKRFGTTENFDIYVNLEKGVIEIQQIKKIVEKVEDPVTEIDLETARKSEPDLEVGEEFLEIVDPATFGRRLIVSAKQNLNQKIREIEKQLTYDEYKNRIGEIVIGDVRQITRDEVFLNVDRTEVVMPRSEQIPTERYHRGETLRAVVKEVRETPRGPVIIVSRADPMFLVRLFELEVPEIYEGIIEIKAIAREPGERTKIAVFSNDKRIDAVGACVGMKGIRIQSIVRELNNEKIDIVPWSPEPEILVQRALSPAKPSKIILDEDRRYVVAVFPDDQISLAIGRGGLNRRLASRLTGYEIETIKESEYRERLMKEAQRDQPLDTVEGLTAGMLKKLAVGDFHTIQQVLDAGVEGLMEVPGIGEKTAQRIYELVKAAAEEKAGGGEEQETAEEASGEQEEGDVVEEALSEA
ncbi:MAG: transcription termination factor NusA [Calditrichaeota bacterium]|nr:transcription termination factor NusA [Calditrichota bacterium]